MRSFRNYAVVATIILAAGAVHGEVGMYPMSELSTVDLEGAGLEIPTAAIYNPDGIALVDGICKLPGCTGSFVSDRGLILTNHHCAFRAIRDASTSENDFQIHSGACAPRRIAFGTSIQSRMRRSSMR